jgi:hypothetical protein
VILHQLHDHAHFRTIVFDRYDAHDIRGVFGVRIRTVLVGEYQARVSLVRLTTMCCIGSAQSHLCSLQIDGVHGGALEELYFGEMSLEHSFQFEVGRYTETLCVLYLFNCLTDAEISLAHRHPHDPRVESQ